MTTIRIPFDAERVADAIHVLPTTPPAEALAALHLPPYRAMIVVHGGASAMEPDDVLAVQRWTVEVLAPLADTYRILIVDGGTDVGTNRVMGAARELTAGTYPLLGVVPAGKVSFPGGPAPTRQRVPLNGWHTHFLLVDGHAFGEESRLMASLLGPSQVPGLALIVNGGPIVLDEVRYHASHDNPTVVLCGTGRVADELADLTSPARCSLPVDAHLELIDVHQPDQFRPVLDRLILARLDGTA